MIGIQDKQKHEIVRTRVIQQEQEGEKRRKDALHVKSRRKFALSEYFLCDRLGFRRELCVNFASVDEERDSRVFEVALHEEYKKILWKRKMVSHTHRE